MNRVEIHASERQYYSAYANEFHEGFAHGYLAELLPYPHFVVWRQELINGQPKKPPYNPNRLGSRADVSDESTWGTWQDALSALSTGHYQGIGFVFTKHGRTPDPFVGLDLDHCADSNRSLHKWAQEIRDFLKTHGHYSPRDGAHFIGKGVLPGPGRKFGPLEFFDRDRYLTLTLHPLPDTPQIIEQCQVEIGSLYLQAAARERPPGRSFQSTGGAAVGQAPETATREAQHLAEERVIREALADHKSNFRRYWLGDRTLWEGPNPLRRSRSEAEHVLALMLLTRTGDSEEDTKRLFQQSGLYDAKRAQRISGHDPYTGRPLTYIDVTIRNALRYRRSLPKA